MMKFQTSSEKSTPAQPPSWVGVDLDGTAAKYTGWKGWDKIGDPVPSMVNRIKGWIKKGATVKIFTARVSRTSLAANNITFEQQAGVIKAWCKEHIGVELEVTAEKDQFMLFFCDDSAVQIKKNTGESLAEDGWNELEVRLFSKLKAESKAKEE